MSLGNPTPYEEDKDIIFSPTHKEKGSSPVIAILSPRHKHMNSSRDEDHSTDGFGDIKEEKTPRKSKRRTKSTKKEAPSDENEAIQIKKRRRKKAGAAEEPSLIPKQRRKSLGTAKEVRSKEA